MPDKTMLKEERFILAHGFRGLAPGCLSLILWVYGEEDITAGEQDGAIQVTSWPQEG
jgi:hypothetical protein